MAGARLTEWSPAELVEMPPGEIVRWIQASIDSTEMIDQWFDLDT